ncbi:MAG: AraC family transcriptional regulator [Bacteroidota bacterium]
MTPALWVSMPIIRNIVMGAVRDPQDVQVICKMGGITSEQLDDAEYKLTLDQNCAVMEAALNISGNPWLGLHIGEKTTPVVLGITGHLMQSSKDALTALDNLQQFTSAFTRLYTFRLEVKDNEACYYCEPLEVWNDMSPETARHSVDIAFAGALHILYLLTGRTFQPKKILYRYPRLADITEHEKILKCRPLFNQPCNCIVFPLADVQFPVIGYNKELNNVFKNLLDAELKKQQNGTSFASEVKQMILKHSQFTFPSLEDIAELMHITPRTLQRKLQEDDTSFRTLTDAIKEELACSLLGNDHLSVADIAYKLGYAEPSTFQRAFRQWTGKTPASYRSNA